MPTYDVAEQFWRDFARLSRAQQELFLAARDKFKEDLERGISFRISLRVKPLQGVPGVWELTWEGNDGRATFNFGSSPRSGQRHVHWRRIGGHEIFDNP